MISTQAVRQAELHAARQTARATEAEAKAARLIEAPPAYDTAEGERILKERLDELRRGTLDALRAAEAKNEILEAENAAATQELQECRRKLAMDHVEAESKLAAELDRLTAETVDAKRQLNDCRRKLAIEKRRAENAPRRERAAAAVALRAQKAVICVEINQCVGCTR